MEIGVSKLLDVSTRHIKQNTAKMLDADWALPHLIRYPKGGYGWFILVYNVTSVGYDDLPQDLAGILRYAEAHGCDWVILDSDGYVHSELPTYEETWESD